MRRSQAERILAHRGYWKGEFGLQNLKQNSLEALARAADMGFGIETDLRDHCREIVISHDPANEYTLTFNQIAELKVEGLVAFNIKSDGLAPLLYSYLKIYSYESFFFDMSFPELRKYAELQLPFASRISEFEDVIHERSQYIWLDSFESEWFMKEELPAILGLDKKIIVVSPELHNRSHLQAWRWIADAMAVNANLFICTDYPGQFLEYLESNS